MKSLIYAALREDINSGWIWVNVPKFKQRSVVCLNNPNTRKKVYCEVLQIDDNFLKSYNTKDGGRLAIRGDSPTLILNEWYRKLLGDLPTKSEYELQISEVDNWLGMIFACVQHPQIIVRVAFWLAAISVALGVVGFIFGIISLCK